MEFIDLKSQYQLIESDIRVGIEHVLKHGRYILGPEVSELEQQLASFVGAKHCIALSSGTDALLVALMACGVKAGDEVITPAFSFIAAAEVIALLGAVPVFVDVDSETYNLCPNSLAEVVTDRTKAIVPVNLFGQCADYDAINTIAKAHNIPVIEDAAQSFGATYHKRSSCTLGMISCTSFFPSKPLGCYGDGGACFTDDDELAESLRALRMHGESGRYNHTRIGINGRLDTLQAAILMVKLKIFPEEVVARARIASQYDTLLAAKGLGASSPRVADYNTSVYAQYTVQIDGRESVIETMKRNEIPTAVHYPNILPAQEAFSVEPGRLQSYPRSIALAEKVMSLPMHPYLEEGDQVRIVDTLAAALDANA